MACGGGEHTSRDFDVIKLRRELRAQKRETERAWRAADNAKLEVQEAWSFADFIEAYGMQELQRCRKELKRKSERFTVLCDHLREHRVLVPGADGRTMQEN